ncbi:hypothetical protein M3J09_003552 [Ascochyta lentis]
MAAPSGSPFLPLAKHTDSKIRNELALLAQPHQRTEAELEVLNDVKNKLARLKGTPETREARRKLTIQLAEAAVGLQALYNLDDAWEKKLEQAKAEHQKVLAQKDEEYANAQAQHQAELAQLRNTLKHAAESRGITLESVEADSLLSQLDQFLASLAGSPAHPGPTKHAEELHKNGDQTHEAAHENTTDSTTEDCS